MTADKPASMSGVDLQQQLDAVRAAPALYLGALVVVTGLIWLAVKYLKDQEVRSLEARLKLRDDEIAELKRVSAKAPVTPHPALPLGENDGSGAPTVALAKPETQQRDKDQVLVSLQKARDNARVAIHQGRGPEHEKAFHELEAAMLSVKERFGIGLLKDVAVNTEKFGRKAILQAYVGYIDAFSPMLREGHSGAAKSKAATFRWNYDGQVG